MDSIAFDNNINNNQEKEFYISTFKRSQEAAMESPKPVIKNLRIIEPNEKLLKRINIKDENDPRYQDKKDEMEDDYQIIGGEVEVNGVTFNLFVVISKKDNLFVSEILKDSNITKEEKIEYIKKNYLILFERFILKSLEDLSRVDHDVLEIIKQNSNPDIVFKSKKTYDFLSSKDDGFTAYAHNGMLEGKGCNITVSFYTHADERPSIVHEFGHLFDYACGITQKKGKHNWEILSKKYSSALKKTTTGCGYSLSGYTKDDYEAMVGEFFADLFDAYYFGDKIKDGNYLIALLDKEALFALEQEIESTKMFILESKLDDEYLLVLSPVLDQMVRYFGGQKDQEMYDLINRFSDLTLYKIYNLSPQIVHSDTFNTIMFYMIAPMIRELKELYEQFSNNPTNENREIIKNKVLGYIDRINNYNKYDLDNRSKEPEKYRIDNTDNENYTVEKDSYTSSQNKAEALIKLSRITDIAFSPNYHFPQEFFEEIFAKQDAIRKKIKEMSKDGLTDIERKVIVDAIEEIVDSMLNFDIVAYRIKGLKKKLLKFHEVICKAIKDHPNNQIYVGFKYFIERAMEFFDSGSIFGKFKDDFDIDFAIMKFDERIGQYLEIPVDRLRYDGIEDLEMFFEFIYDSFELDDMKENSK